VSLQNEATRRQHDAAEPTHSTWLSANAGSGKTRVLTDRAARLLLDGVPPERILCLTYTKAAAAEMQNRLFGNLGKWAMLPDNELGEALQEIGATSVDNLNAARTLFARAIETPGGLKIQTIHSFCAAILRRFPVEAGVTPDFKEIDEIATKRLISEVTGALADSIHGAALDEAGRYLTADSFEGIALEVLKRQDDFPGEMSKTDVLGLFDLPGDFTEKALADQVFLESDDAVLATLVKYLREGSSADQKAAAKIGLAISKPLSHLTLTDLESVFLFGSKATHAFGPKVDSFPTKATREKLAAEMDAINALMTRVADARPSRLALEAAERTHALHRFADAFLPAYRSAKAARGWVDFDDLIRKTRTLLKSAPSAAWVLYKLDGGIDHILVDEAQDTSPEQWEVIALLTEEMVAGEGRGSARPRTVFVVGDTKQSIYSFQGADPEAFNRMANHFDARLAAQGGLNKLQLVHSFRSSAAVLSSVDQAYFGAAGPDEGGRHRAFFSDLPGRVDLWPVVPKAEKDDRDAWWNPVDLVGKNHHSVILATRIAEFIREAIDTEHLPTRDGRRPVTAGDFLILVQGRKTPLFHNIIRALKTAELPVAGADRLKLAAELAVKDVLSLLRFLALPEDDLALAEALRSPLFGVTEKKLFHLAHPRPGYLWAALRDNLDDFKDIHERLQALLKDADFERPYELLEKILTDQRGRERLLARLGTEAEDGLDLLLSQALNYETAEIPSLTGFLEWAQGGEAEIKRQADQAGGQIRVMTVHGAKGLESEIVIMPDTLKKPRGVRGDILTTPDGIAVWKGRVEQDPMTIAQARALAESKDAAERRRLLYVAMTRAKQWMVVCGSGENKPDDKTWYSEINSGLQSIGAGAFDLPTGNGLRLSHGDWGAGEPSTGPDTPAKKPMFPDWIDTPIAPPSRPDQPLSPSGLGGAKAISGDGGDRDAALTYGTALHQLLEHLPNHDQADWPGLANALGGGNVAQLLEDARRVLSTKEIAHLFVPGTLAEVPICARLPELDGRTIAGEIDRLIVSDTSVLAVDYKSNAIVPKDAADVPDSILRQMGAYAAALSQVFPDRDIQTAILWTNTAELMVLPHDIVMKSLRNTPTS
jgi:ATP-dependent helicase/nuclease subunit A